MAEEQKEQNLEAEEDEGINILDYLIVLAKHKKLIISITISVAILTIIYTLFLPNTYWARTTVLLPKTSIGPAWMQMLGQITGVAGSTDSGISDPNLFSQLLYTGPVLDKIIDKFKLAESYEVDTKKDLRDMLSSSISTDFILPENAGRGLGPRTSRLLMISVLDKDQQKAADMANAFVEALQELLRDIAVSAASQRRFFFEEQLKQSKEDLIKAEEAMKEFQEKKGALKVDTQAQVLIESIADLKGKIAAKEVELQVMRTYTTENNPDLQRTIATLNGLKDQLKKLQKKDTGNPDLFLSIEKVPEISTDYVRKLRDLKYQETIYEILSKQYEAARMQEAQNPAIIQVLEKAYPSEERAGPERRKKVMFATVASFLFSILLAFALEFIERYKGVSPENREKIERLTLYLSFKEK